MNWEIIRPGIVDLLATITGLQTVYEEDPRPMVDPRKLAIVLFKFRPVRAVGSTDSREEEYDANRPQGSEFQEVVQGARAVTLSIKVESFPQTPRDFALNMAERLRDSFSFTSTRKALLELELALVKCQPVQDLDRNEDGHRLSVAVLDVLLNAHVRRVDEANRYGWIETVELGVNLHGSKLYP